jgi:hypothetical protein
MATKATEASPGYLADFSSVAIVAFVGFSPINSETRISRAVSYGYPLAATELIAYHDLPRPLAFILPPRGGRFECLHRVWTGCDLGRACATGGLR